MLVLPILIVIATIFFFEVVLGSASSARNPEIGLAHRPFRAERIAAGEFFKKPAPLVLVSIG